MALLFSLIRRIPQFDKEVRSGVFPNDAEHAYKISEEEAAKIEAFFNEQK